MYKVTDRKIDSFLDCCKNAKIDISLKEKIPQIKYYKSMNSYRKVTITHASYWFWYSVGLWKGYIVNGDG